jgi:hypothetical protein
MCGRLLILPRTAIVVAGMLLLALLGLALWGSGKAKSRLAWGETRPADAYKAAVAFVAKNPIMRGAVKFSKLEESVVERWDVGLWRVSGFADMPPRPGVKTRVLYYCVLQYIGVGHWAIQDMQFEKVE